MFVLTQYTLIPLISLILYVFILIILLTSNKNKLSNAFSLYIMAMIIWSLGSLLMKTDLPPNSTFWNRFLLIGFVTVPVLLLRFSYIMSENYTKKWVVYLGYVLAVYLMILSFTGNITTNIEFADGVFTYDIVTPGAYISAVILTSYSILALITMTNKVRRKEMSIKKVRLVIIGISLVVIGGALNLNTFLGQYAIDILFNAINAILITYSISRNKFLEINLVVKKGLSFIIYVLVVYGVYVAAVVLSYRTLDSWGISSLMYLIIFISPVFFILEPVRNFLQKTIINIFFRAVTDQQIILRKFSSLVNSAISLDTITDSLVKAIQDGIDPKDVTILLKNSNKYHVGNTTIPNINKEEHIFKFNHPIVKWFDNGKKILLSNQIHNHVIFKGLWDEEKRVITDFKTEVVSPIIYLDELIGMIIISERKDETPYSQSEIEFLETLINNAAAIIENAKTIESIKKQSITDELTKLYNHRYFHDTAGAWVRDKKYDTFSIAMIDIDQFKIYNDLYGHSAGDIALKKIAGIISDATSKNDLLVRYGGEEFVIFYPNIEGKAALKEIDRIREKVEEDFLFSRDIKEFLTVTVGVSSYPKDGTTLEDIVSKADRAMFHGKKIGRNKSVVFKEDVSINKTLDEEANEKIRDAHVASIYALAATIDAKDHYTYGHSSNVAAISAALAKEANFSETDIETVQNAGLLHDIGKVGIPESVLSKPGVLTEEEMDIMKSHVIQSINIIKHIPNLLETVPVIVSHHERYDGQGYPRGIKGEQIPILGRVICIADSFDAMTTDRPYRKGLSIEQAIYELNKNKAKQFDPILVDIFVNMINDGKIAALNLENRPSV